MLANPAVGFSSLSNQKTVEKSISVNRQKKMYVQFTVNSNIVFPKGLAIPNSFGFGRRVDVMYSPFSP